MIYSTSFLFSIKDFEPVDILQSFFMNCKVLLGFKKAFKILFKFCQQASIIIILFQYWSTVLLIGVHLIVSVEIVYLTQKIS